VFSFIWLVVISSLSSSLFSSIYFSSVIEVLFRCYFRITRRSMLRSQDELNTSPSRKLSFTHANQHCVSYQHNAVTNPFSKLMSQFGFPSPIQK